MLKYQMLNNNLDSLKEIYLQNKLLSNEELVKELSKLEVPIDEHSRKSILYSRTLAETCFRYYSKDIDSHLVSKFLDIVFQIELENQVPAYMVRAVLNIFNPIVFSRMILTLAIYQGH